MSEKWVCVHGHFYQPPRENPWLEEIEPQPSARPYPDWNARITAECYRPNTAARVVDAAGTIIAIVDNYQRMSFNVGPTLMSWLALHAADVHAALIAADRASMARFSGHGSALAQAYNHMIMPLASARDRLTQVRWGIADFRYRFGRAPEGMWLPECAVDTATLEALAAEGIAFTILAPSQAAAWRPPGGAWRTNNVDPGRAYRCPLPSGRSIDLFFYDGATAQAVAFERLLADGHQIIARMIDRDGVEGGGPTLCHIATDGETYGHHHRYGDMALAWALSQVERGWRGTRLTNYAELRAKAPATWEARIVEGSSWSCAHGVARWREDCGCNSGGHPGWRQAWRRPLRDALDWLRDQAAAAFDDVGARLFRDPWAVRDAYVEVVLERSAAARRRFLDAHAAHALDPAERVRALSLMELGRHAMLMYTSCGWFFDDLAGIETVQCLQYAARVAELIEAVGGAPVEAAFVDRLSAGRSNLAEVGDGRQIWRTLVEPARVGASKIAAHVVVAALVERGEAVPTHPHVYGHDVEFHDVLDRRAGRIRLIAGRIVVRSQLTEATSTLAFAALHLGEHHLIGGVAAPLPEAVWQALLGDLGAALKVADVFAAQRAIEGAFGVGGLSLGALLPGSREHLLGAVLAEAITRADGELGAAYDHHAPLIRWLVSHELPVPEVLHATAEAALRRRVLTALRASQPSMSALRGALAEAAEAHVDVDTPEIALAASDSLRRLMARLRDDPDDDEALDAAARGVEIALRMKSAVDLWDAQNTTWSLLPRLPALRAGDAAEVARGVTLERLARALRLQVPG
jgi:hypothetical protein